ncbi:MAG TPA: hypothetical protein VNV66_17490, partial [Pilimelia sp.]|nr:hypothetical protein [Pilimelia sp.]
CAARPYTAQARADLLRLDALAAGTPLAGVRLASSVSALAADHRIAAVGAARTLDASVAGVTLPAGPLGAVVSQQAPPQQPRTATASAARRHLGAATVGVGTVHSRALWRDGMRCGAATGRAATAGAELADLAILPAGGGALISARQGLSSGTQTGLTGHRGTTAATARAEIGVASLSLFPDAAGAAALRIDVLRPPALTVTHADRPQGATVHYEAPVVGITGSGIGDRRLTAPNEVIEIAVPTGAAPPDVARRAARAAGLPLLDGAALSRLPQLAGTGLVPALPGTRAGAGPVPTGGAPGGAATGAATDAVGPIAVLRLALGELRREAGPGGGVRAHVTVLRLSIAPTGAGGAGAPVQLSIGVLEAGAAARGGYPTGTPSPAPTASPGPSSGGPTAGPGASPSSGGAGSATATAAATSAVPSPAGASDEEGGGSLPVTGGALGLLLAGGGLLLAGGRLLTLLSRRRTPTP